MANGLNFHYKRDERLAMRSAPSSGQPERGGPRGNRRSLVLLLNLVLIVALFAIYARSQARAAHTAELSGWRFTLRGVAAGDDVLAVVEGTSVAATAARTGAGDQRLFVVLRAGEADLRLSELLPAGGGSITLSGRLIASGGARDLSAELAIGGEKRTLRRLLDRD